MIKLITITDIANFKPISLNVNEAKQLDPYIFEAQEFDLKPIIGDQLYLKILDDAPNFATPRFADLFNEKRYIYDNEEFKHEGIKASLIYYVYARYLSNANSHSTAFGIVGKKNDYSDPVSEQTIKRLIQQAKSGAIAYQNDYLKFICRFSEIYPEYCMETANSSKRLSTKIRQISNT